MQKNYPFSPHSTTHTAHLRVLSILLCCGGGKLEPPDFSYQRENLIGKVGLNAEQVGLLLRI
jgi:hypothetical protein